MVLQVIPVLGVLDIRYRDGGRRAGLTVLPPSNRVSFIRFRRQPLFHAPDRRPKLSCHVHLVCTTPSVGRGTAFVAWTVYRLFTGVINFLSA